jgi:hypothetical protein
MLRGQLLPFQAAHTYHHPEKPNAEVSQGEGVKWKRGAKLNEGLTKRTYSRDTQSLCLGSLWLSRETQE